MTKTEIIDQLKDLIRDRESFLDGTDDNIFCRDIAALKGAIELIENRTLRLESLDGSSQYCLGVMFTDRSEKTIKYGYEWEIDGDFMYFFDVDGRTIAAFKAEDVQGVIYMEDGGES